MDNLEFIIGAVAGWAVALLLFWLFRKRPEKAAEAEEAAPKIPIEPLPPELVPEESELMEITDSNVLSEINAIVPELIQVAEDVNDVVYRAVIPAGGEPGLSPDAAVFGEKGAAAVNLTAAAMGVASLVVGQYYMTKINGELGELNRTLSGISSAMDNEYRSRVMSLIAHVKGISDFRAEILENNELRLSKISHLDTLEEYATELLGQANLTLSGYAERNNLDFNGYKKAVAEVQTRYEYQRVLTQLLGRIADLRFTLHLGKVSYEQCTAVLSTYARQNRETGERLAAWHSECAERLRIDLDEGRIKRYGLDKYIHLLPGLINEDMKYKALDEGTARLIEGQSSGIEQERPSNSDLYSGDVRLYAKNGRVYYLPEK